MADADADVRPDYSSLVYEQEAPSLDNVDSAVGGKSRRRAGSKSKTKKKSKKYDGKRRFDLIYLH